MTISAFDLFKVGIGPSSSHTVGPMRAACSFALRLQERGTAHAGRPGPLRAVRLARRDRARARQRQGRRPGAGGRTARARRPEHGRARASSPSASAGKLSLAGEHPIAFSVDDDVVLHRRKRLDFHTNGMVFRALDAEGAELDRREYYSVGGGFVLDEDEAGNPVIVEDSTPVRYPFHTGEELLAHARESGLRISDIMLANELSWRSEAGGPRGSAAHLVGDAGVRRARDPHRRRASRRPQGPQARRRAARPAGGPPGRHRPAAGDGVGDPLRAGGERGERRRWPRGHGADQRRRRDRAGRPALLPATSSAPTPTTAWCGSC